MKVLLWSLLFVLAAGSAMESRSANYFPPGAPWNYPWDTMGRICCQLPDSTMPIFSHDADCTRKKGVAVNNNRCLEDVCCVNERGEKQITPSGNCVAPRMPSAQLSDCNHLPRGCCYRRLSCPDGVDYRVEVKKINGVVARDQRAADCLPDYRFGGGSQCEEADNCAKSPSPNPTKSPTPTPTASPTGYPTSYPTTGITNGPYPVPSYSYSSSPSPSGSPSNWSRY